MKNAAIYAATLFLSSALALPSAGNVGSGSSVAARDVVKFNQYKTLDDCKNDRDILYHAAPVSARCYDIDDATGAFFYNSAGFTQVHLYNNKGCTGDDQKLPIYGGLCMEKGGKNSIKMW
ncbi:hypothetical protein CkaCkLH20_07919 [Colletotrichum karsti]|uniref:Uncharacterized protein n=1 Tax=Colletotrichum karsti TaxID=1095194 RepID=A0A9P6I0M7_9PEZI|nr:uncharacterized protein CkaCkLH20_07919 [Colletotrichum karsti]KAF9874782.1 hypothetical protein CkaCkLH20_07919 [Colletotrichum karsti]